MTVLQATEAQLVQAAEATQRLLGIIRQRLETPPCRPTSRTQNLPPRSQPPPPMEAVVSVTTVAVMAQARPVVMVAHRRWTADTVSSGSRLLSRLLVTVLGPIVVMVVHRPPMVVGQVPAMAQHLPQVMEQESRPRVMVVRLPRVTEREVRPRAMELERQEVVADSICPAVMKLHPMRRTEVVTTKYGLF